MQLHFRDRIVPGTAIATTTSVIFSFKEDRGEYADVDLATNGAGNIYGRTLLGGEFGGDAVVQFTPTLTGWNHKKARRTGV